MKKLWMSLAFTALIAVIVVLIVNRPSSSQDWAAWVQAIGATIALFIAIAVPLLQHENAVKRESAKIRDEIRHDLQSLRVELHVAIEGLRYSTRGGLDKQLNGKAYESFMRPDPNNPTVYASIAGRIGRFPNEDLSKQIIRIYAKYKGLMMDFSTHADHVERMHEAEVAFEQMKESSLEETARYRNAQNYLSARKQDLIDYSERLQLAYETTLQEMGDVIRLLSDEIEKT